jgi:hypothetical protein
MEPIMASFDGLLPKAADCRRRVAEVEAEKATELMRKETAADAESVRYSTGYRTHPACPTRSG